MCARVGIAVPAILALGNQPAKPQAKNSFNGFALVDKSGNIEKAADYRDLYDDMARPFQNQYRDNKETTQGGGR